jgi:hypothetical protein
LSGGQIGVAVDERADRRVEVSVGLDGLVSERYRAGREVDVGPLRSRTRRRTSGSSGENALHDR